MDNIVYEKGRPYAEKDGFGLGVELSIVGLIMAGLIPFSNYLVKDRDKENKQQEFIEEANNAEESNIVNVSKEKLNDYISSIPEGYIISYVTEKEDGSYDVVIEEEKAKVKTK